MSTEVLVAILGLIGTLSGSFLGILASSKLTNYRLQKLEEKVNKHNNVIERVYKLEGRADEFQSDISDLINLYRSKN